MSNHTSKGHDPRDAEYPAHRLSAKVNLSKLNKDWFFVNQKGEKILDLVMFTSPDKLAEYGDAYVIYQSPSKEARAAGAKGAIVGNAKCWEQTPRTSGNQPTPASRPARSGPKEGPDGSVAHDDNSEPPPF